MFSLHARLPRAVSLLIFGSLLATLPALAAAVPFIEHSPVHNAVPGQPIQIRARISGGTPRSVTLLFATSKDAAPFKLPMSPSGPGMYSGRIPDAMLPNLTEVYYYIEARDSADVPVETPWYTIRLSSTTGSEKGGGGSLEASGKGGADSEGRGWVKPALIGGGILAAGGLAYALSSGGGDDDDGGGGGGDPGGGTSPAAGVYSGSDTTCSQYPGLPQTCESTPLTISISSAGVVSAEDLRTGQSLNTTLDGNSFVLVAGVNENGFTGEIQYLGNIVGNRIVGSIQGSATSVGGVAIFSGNFSALRP